MPKFSALLVGVPKYDDPNIDDLDFIEPEIHALARALISAGYSVVIHDFERTDPARIDQEIERFCASADPETTLLIYLSGHGIHHEGKDYLVPSSANTKLGQLWKRCLEIDFMQHIENGQANNVVIAIDACRTGIRANTKSLSVGWGAKESFSIQERTVAYFYGCRTDKGAYFIDIDPGGRVSVFTEAFRRSIENPTRDPTLGQLADQVQAQMDALTTKAGTSEQQSAIMGDIASASKMLLLPHCDNQRLSNVDVNLYVPDSMGPWVEPSGEPSLLHRCAQHPFLIVTGAPGSGKSRLIDELRKSMSQDEWRIPSQTAPPLTESWRRMALQRPSLAHWEAVWRAIFLLTAFTHIHQHRSHLPNDQQKSIGLARDTLPSELVNLDYVRHPFAVANILSSQPFAMDPESTIAYFRQPTWDHIEEIVRSTDWHAVPRLMVEVDHFDDYYDNNPSVMAEVHAGLALCMDRFAQRPFGLDRVRLHATIRATTRKFIMRNNGKDISHSPAFIEILWTKDSIVELLEGAILREVANGLPGLISDTAISVPERGTQEVPLEYLLRHTTLTPRDATQLAHALLSRRLASHGTLSSSEVRNVVAQFAQCLANFSVQQVVSDLRAFARRSSGVGLAEGGDEEQEFLKRRLLQEIESTHTETIGWIELQDMVERWDDATKPHLIVILWIYRLIARYDRDRRRILLAQSIADGLGADAEDLIFHPILMDLLDPLEYVMEELHVQFA